MQRTRHLVENVIFVQNLNYKYVHNFQERYVSIYNLENIPLEEGQVHGKSIFAVHDALCHSIFLVFYAAMPLCASRLSLHIRLDVD